MKTELFNRLVVAKKQLDKDGVEWVTITLQTKDALEFDDKLALSVCEAMERMVVLFNSDKKENGK